MIHRWDSFFHTHGITIDLPDNVYVTNSRENSQISVLIASKFLKLWESEGKNKANLSSTIV